MTRSASLSTGPMGACYCCRKAMMLWWLGCTVGRGVGELLHSGLAVVEPVVIPLPELLRFLNVPCLVALDWLSAPEFHGKLEPRVERNVECGFRAQSLREAQLPRERHHVAVWQEHLVLAAQPLAREPADLLLGEEELLLLRTRRPGR